MIVDGLLMIDELLDDLPVLLERTYRPAVKEQCTKQSNRSASCLTRK